MKGISIRATLIAGAIACANTALACGESLFHVGKGVVFREYTAPLPGKILMVARTEGELMMAERLEAAGHEVQVVADPSQIGNALSVADYDIVMTLFTHRQTVEEQTRNVASSATYLPVAQHDTEEERAARAVTRNALSTDDSVKRFLRAIHRTLKSTKT